MKKLLIKIAMFVFIPIIILGTIEAVISPAAFTNRPWEAIFFQSKVPHTTISYPNQRLAMKAEGDLRHHTNKAIASYQVWVTDQLGFRNDRFVKKADVLFIGDSFIAGCNLDQQETISNRLTAKFGNKTKVYNMAPFLFAELDEYLKKGIIQKPKCVVYSCVERNIPGVMGSVVSKKKSAFHRTLAELLSAGNTNVYLDKAFRHFSINWMRARIREEKGGGLPSKNAKMFFNQGMFREHESKDLEKTANAIISYKKYCDAIGVRFIYLPMPDKESVYYEYVPFKTQPGYLFQLDSLLQLANIETINTLKIYNDYRKKSSTLLYHLDDSHWNSTAVELIADELVKKLKSQK